MSDLGAHDAALGLDALRGVGQAAVALAASDTLDAIAEACAAALATLRGAALVAVDPTAADASRVWAWGPDATEARAAAVAAAGHWERLPLLDGGRRWGELVVPAEARAGAGAALLAWLVERVAEARARRFEARPAAVRASLVPEADTTGYTAAIVSLSRARDVDLERFFERVTEEVAAAMQVDRVSVWRLEGGAIVCDDLFEVATGRHSAGTRLEAKDFRPYFEALERDETIAATDAHSHPSTACFSAVYLSPLGISSMLDVPLRSIDGVRGVICAESFERRPWRRAELQFCGEVGSLVVQALDRSARQSLEQRQGVVLASIADGVIACDATLRVMLMNPTAERLCDVAPGAGIGRPLEAVLRLVDGRGAPLGPLGAGVIARGRPEAFEGIVRVRRDDGSEAPVFHAASPIVEEGEVTGVVLTLRDATSEEASARLISERTRRLRSLGDAIPDLVASIAVDGAIEVLKGSKAGGGFDLFGAATTARAALGDAVGARLEAAARTAVARGELQSIEFEVAGPEGPRAFEARCAPLDEATATAIVRDVSVERGRESALARERERLGALLASSGAIIYAARLPDFAVDYVSHSMLTVLGYTFEEASAPGFWEASLHPDDRARVLGGLGGLMAHGRHVHEYRHRHRDGSYRWVRDDIRLVYDAQGTPVRAVGASIDITSRKRDEARLTALVAAQQVVSRLSNRFLSRVHGDAGEAIAEGLAGLARAFEAPSGYLARLGDDGALQARWRVTAQGAAVAGDPDFVTAPAGSEGAAEEARWCWVPMVLGGRRVGVVGVEAPWSEAVDRAELTPLLQLFADTTAAGLRRAEDEASLRAATDRLTAVNVRQQTLIELSTALAGTANLRGLERALMAFAPRLLDADQITLGRRLPTGEYVVRVVRYREGAPGDSRPGVGGAFDDPRERVIPTVEALAIGLALRTGRPVTTLDHRVEDFPDWRDLRERDGFEQFAVVPLAGASGSLGTIKFASRSARRWSRDDLSWATQLSLLVGGQLSALEASAALRSVNDDLEARVSQRTRELRASEERFELLFRNAPQAMIICDAGGRVVQSNLAAQELFGYDEAGFTGRPLADLMPPSARAAHPGLVERFMGRRQARPMAALRAIPARRADGADFSAEIGLVPLELSGEAQVLAGITDVSLRIAAQDALTRSLREKEVLLKEIHHRVKNNLQIISSLLMLQSEKMPAEAARYMHESVYRVRSMALIHQQFYGTESLDRIDLGGHARNLAVSLVGMLCPSARVQVEADPVTVSIDLAVPLGLILNELLTNALKYAVAPSQRRTSVVGDDARREPDIRVRVTSLDGELRLVVHDRGDGLPEGIDPARSGTLGMQLIRSLTRQVRGKLAATNDGGARFEVTCPLPTE